MTNLEFNLVQEVLRTLPIGYYLGRNIEVELSHDDHSYYMPDKDKIVIGYGSIKRSYNMYMSNASDMTEKYQFDLEELVRSILYHEISHVILTPARLKSMALSKYDDIINMPADEAKALCDKCLPAINKLEIEKSFWNEKDLAEEAGVTEKEAKYIITSMNL